LAEHEETLERMVETLKEPVKIDPSLDLRVMAAIERQPLQAHASYVRSLGGWLRRRRTIQVSPLSGLAAAAGLAALLVGGSRMLRPEVVITVPAVSAAAEGQQATQFVLIAPEAASVSVVGDFNDWSLSATPLVRQAKDGVWWVTVPLQPGRYRYAFLVNGQDWRVDPNAPAAEDEFGRPNSVVTIGGGI
jgi:hypothetical protein